MNEKSTIELEQVLRSKHARDFKQFCDSNRECVIPEDKPFVEYFKLLFKEKGITQQTVFLKADIPERYGYKLLSSEKHTKQRDVILRICYAAEFTLTETQRALKKYGMPELYAKISRDALLMIMFNERPGSIADVNEVLQKHGMDPLRTSGTQE